MAIIEVDALTKVYKGGFRKPSVTALKEFSLEVEPGTIFGLLGRNGAGKTTFIKLLLAIISPTSGSFSVFGEEGGSVAYKKKIGYLPENHKFPGFLTGSEVLFYMAGLSQVPSAQIKSKITANLKLVGLSEAANKKVKTYSKGMMQRLGLAQALIHDPEIIFLDEPTDGVDPIGRKEIRDLLIHLKEQGKTIFLNSHILSEVELITDRVAIIEKGELLKEGTVKDLTTSQREYKLFTGSEVVQHLPEALKESYSMRVGKDGFYYFTLDSNAIANELLQEVINAKIEVKEFSEVRHSLEEIFIQVVTDAEVK